MDSRPTRRTHPQAFAWKVLLFVGASTASFLGLEALGWLVGVVPLSADADPYAGFARHVPHFPREVQDGEEWVTVAPAKRSVLNPVRFRAKKPPGVYRIVCLGGSTTYGRPFYDETSFAGWLRSLLARVDTSRNWEVINAGAISYASYRVLEVMRELAAFQPDLYIVYTGQNEFLERRTYQGRIERIPWLSEAVFAMNRTRTAALFRHAFDRLGIPRAPLRDGKTALGGDVSAIPVNAVGQEAYQRDDSLSADVVRHFRSTLKNMARAASRGNAGILFAVPSSNLADFAPFKSEHRAGLGASELGAWSKAFTEARSLADAERWENALGSVQRARTLDDRHAETWYLEGKIRRKLGDRDGSRLAFERARDEDVCPLRAIGTIVAAVREMERELPDHVVDFDALLASTSPDGIPGRGEFYDHVHPTIAANRSLAIAILVRMEKLGWVRPTSEWQPALVAEVEQSIWNRLDRNKLGGELRKAAIMLGRLGQEPLARHVAIEALSMSGDSEELRLGLAEGFLSHGAPELAAWVAREILEKTPESIAPRLVLARALAGAGNAGASMEVLREASRLQPDNGEVRVRLGMAHALRGEYDVAGRELQEAIRLLPASALARNQLGRVLLRLDRYPEAAERFREALELDPRIGGAREGLAEAKRLMAEYSAGGGNVPEHEKASGATGGLPPRRF